ncbi:PKD domain protein [uncultured archaeon]|nr:PKD domain protein [uncultured archaeon]
MAGQTVRIESNKDIFVYDQYKNPVVSATTGNPQRVATFRTENAGNYYIGIYSAQAGSYTVTLTLGTQGTMPGYTPPQQPGYPYYPTPSLTPAVPQESGSFENAKLINGTESGIYQAGNRIYYKFFANASDQVRIIPTLATGGNLGISMYDPLRAYIMCCYEPAFVDFRASITGYYFMVLNGPVSGTFTITTTITNTQIQTTTAGGDPSTAVPLEADMQLNGNSLPGGKTWYKFSMNAGDMVKIMMNPGPQENQGPGYQPPQTGTGYMPPQTGTGYMPPQTGTGYMPPQTGTGYMPPQSGTGYQPYQSYPQYETGPVYQPPAYQPYTGPGYQPNQPPAYQPYPGQPAPGYSDKDLYLFADPTQRYIKFSSTPGLSVESIVYTADRAGDYYAMVQDTSGLGGSYTIRLKKLSEGNGTSFQDAKFLNGSSSGTIQSGYIYYKFIANAGHQITVSSNKPVYIYDPALTFVKQGTGSVTFTPLMSGPYFIVVDGSTSGGSYEISVDVAVQSPVIYITFPYGGEVMQAGSQRYIVWSAYGGSGDLTVDLGFSTTGVDGNYMLINSSLPNTGHYQWTVPDAASTNVYVKAIVRDGDGRTSSDTSNAPFTISSTTGSITANANGPYFGIVNTGLQFRATATGGTLPNIYNWDFRDGSNSNLENPTHIYTSTGNYTAHLKVIDSTGRRALDNATVRIDSLTVSGSSYNNAIILSGAASGNINQGDSFYYKFYATAGQQVFVNLAPVSGDQDIIVYDVNRRYLNSSQHTGTVSESVTLTASLTGYYYVVVNGISTGSYSLSVSTGGAGQSLSAEAGDPYSGAVNADIEFYGSANGGTPPYLTYLWSFGDGGTSTQQNPVHRYSNAGTFTATLTVFDSAGTIASGSVIVSVGQGASQNHADTSTSGADNSEGAVARSISPSSVQANDTLNITLTPSPGSLFASPGYQVVETIPQGFVFVSSAGGYVNTGNVYTFTQIGSAPITYTIMAPSTNGSYVISGTFKDQTRKTGTVSGTTSIGVGSGGDLIARYETSGNGRIDRTEAVRAVADFFSGSITRQDAISLVMAYFSG